MNLKILFLILIYYTVISLFFVFGGSYMTGYTSNIDLNDTDLSTTELDKGGLFNSGISFTRFVTFVGFGIGLPSDTPLWFKTIFSAWQTLILIFTIGFIISSIWNG